MWEIANAFAAGFRGASARTSAAAGDQPPAAAEHGEHSEGDSKADRAQDQQEDHEGDYRERNEEDVHAA